MDLNSIVSPGLKQFLFDVVCYLYQLDIEEEVDSSEDLETLDFVKLVTVQVIAEKDSFDA